MKKKINFKVLFSLLIILLFICFIVYKFVMLQKYKAEYIAINNNKIFNEIMDIEYKEDNNIILFEDMLYFDCFFGYANKENTSFKVKYNENSEVSSFYNIVKEKQYITILNINSFKLISNEENVNYSTDKNMQELLDDNQIKDDIDLMKYIKEHYYLKSNLFTTTKTMKNNFIINQFIQVSFPEFESVTLIKGDKIKGYILNIKSTINIKEIHLLYNDNQYIITLAGNEITDTSFIKSLLESISFN